MEHTDLQKEANSIIQTYTFLYNFIFKYSFFAFTFVVAGIIHYVSLTYFPLTFRTVDEGTITLAQSYIETYGKEFRSLSGQKIQITTRGGMIKGTSSYGNILFSGGDVLGMTHDFSGTVSGSISFEALSLRPIISIENPISSLDIDCISVSTNEVCKSKIIKLLPILPVFDIKNTQIAEIYTNSIKKFPDLQKQICDSYRTLFEYQRSVSFSLDVCNSSEIIVSKEAIELYQEFLRTPSSKVYTSENINKVKFQTFKNLFSNYTNAVPKITLGVYADFVQGVSTTFSGNYFNEQILNFYNESLSGKVDFMITQSVGEEKNQLIDIKSKLIYIPKDSLSIQGSGISIEANSGISNATSGINNNAIIQTGRNEEKIITGEKNVGTGIVPVVNSLCMDVKKVLSGAVDSCSNERVSFFQGDSLLVLEITNGLVVSLRASQQVLNSKLQTYFAKVSDKKVLGVIESILGKEYDIAPNSSIDPSTLLVISNKFNDFLGVAPGDIGMRGSTYLVQFQINSVHFISVYELKTHTLSQLFFVFPGSKRAPIKVSDFTLTLDKQSQKNIDSFVKNPIQYLTNIDPVAVKNRGN